MTELPTLYSALINPESGIPLPEYATAGSACFDLRADLTFNGHEPLILDPARVLITRDQGELYVQNYHLSVRDNILLNGDRLNFSLWSEAVTVPTGRAYEISEGWVMMVAVRSGLAFKKGIQLVNGVGIIDSDYTGEVKVRLYNTSNTPFTIEHGDRIAQAWLQPAYQFNIQPKDHSDFKDTERGAGGFGHTGRR